MSTAAITRLDFLATLAAAGAAVLLTSKAQAEEPYKSVLEPERLAKLPNKGPKLDAEMVRDFVIVAHGDLEKTAALLDRQPALVNATYDWGAGDWETGLGGASHVGRPDIANFLLSHGARKDVFCAAMLGDLPLVRAFVDTDPAIVHLKGPHGIPLLVHAQHGKQDAVVAFLREKGAQG